MDESVEMITFKNDGFDGAIRFGNGDFENLDAAHLISIRGYAVASPAYIEKFGRPESIQNPEGHKLIDHFFDSKSISSQHIHWRDIVDDDLEDMNIEHLVYPMICSLLPPHCTARASPWFRNTCSRPKLPLERSSRCATNPCTNTRIDITL